MSMRKKEGLADYRYFPDPDLPPLHTPAAFVAAVRDSMAELPAALRARLQAAGLPVDVVLILAEDVQTARYYDAVVAAGGDAVQAGNWIQRDIMAWCNENNVRARHLLSCSRCFFFGTGSLIPVATPRHVCSHPLGPCASLI
jgi:aspartyl-tRNA(Asn)/glutamyl-tRNA(Gln) amidotransferase subunit B